MKLLRRGRATVVALLLAGCAFGPRVRAIEPGMQSQQVTEHLGKPDGQRLLGVYTVYTYTNRLISGWSNTRADYHVVLDSAGKVVAYGPGEVRLQPNNTVLIVPIR